VSSRSPASLVDAASACYRDSGRFAWHFARGKLAGDPVFTAILAQGLLEGHARVLDLGCGQGLLAAWLLAARAGYEASGTWPQGWPAPPHLDRYTGVEINPHEAARACAAGARYGAARISIVQADVRHVDYAEADAIVMLDVLHYMDRASQESVLAKARCALAPGGRLLLRVGDAAGGAGFTVSQLVDTAVAFARHRRPIRLHCRPLREWLEVLAHAGFSARVVTRSHGAAFSNVLLLAQAA
jgi:SAM-dependent methyltransferase